MFGFNKNKKEVNTEDKINAPKGYPLKEKLVYNFIRRVQNTEEKDIVNNWINCTIYEVVDIEKRTYYTFSLDDITNISSEEFIKIYDENGYRIFIKIENILKIRELEFTFGLFFGETKHPKVIEIMESDFSDSYRINKRTERVFSTRTLMPETKKESWFSSLFSDNTALEIYSHGRFLNGED